MRDMNKVEARLEEIDARAAARALDMIEELNPALRVRRRELDEE